MSETTNNGYTNWSDGFSTDAFERLSGIGYGDHESNNNGSDPPRRGSAKDQPPPHDFERHPEDPPGAYRLAAEEVADPEKIRRGANNFGMASQAIPSDRFRSLARRLYQRVHEVRIGAIVIPARREAGEKLKHSAGTDAEIAKIRAEGIADSEKADRLETDVVPRVEKEHEKAAREVEEKKERVASTRRELGRVRAEEAQLRGRRAEEPRSWSWKLNWLRLVWVNLLARTGYSSRKAWMTFLAEVGASSFLLAPKIADVVGVSFLEGLAISFAISIAMLAVAFAAGAAVAAIRLPGWLVGVAIVAAFAGILIKFAPALDVLRRSGDGGVEVLTAATLAAFLIAMISGYALAAAADQRREIEAEEDEARLLKRAGTPLGEALEVLSERTEEYEHAKLRHDHLRKLLDALGQKIEDLRDFASRAPAKAAERKREGIEADVEAATIRAIAAAGVKQERAAAEWAYLIALAAHDKARLEGLPEFVVPEVPTLARAAEGAGRRSGGLSLLLGLALATLAASGVASLMVGPVALGVGIPLAVLLVLLDRSRGGPGGPGGPPAPVDSIIPPADGDDPLFRYQPDHMRSKYRNGGARVGQRQ
jgi:hypothetical protein